MPVDALGRWLAAHGETSEAAHADATPGEILLRSYREAVRDLHALRGSSSRWWISFGYFLNSWTSAQRRAAPTNSVFGTAALRRRARWQEPSADSRGAARPDKARPEDAQDAEPDAGAARANTKAAPKRQPRKPGGTTQESVLMKNSALQAGTVGSEGLEPGPAIFLRAAVPLGTIQRR